MYSRDTYPGMRGVCTAGTPTRVSERCIYSREATWVPWWVYIQQVGYLGTMVGMYLPICLPGTW